MSDRLVNEPTTGNEESEVEIFDLMSNDPEPEAEAAPTQEQQPSATAGEENHDESGTEEPWMAKYKGKTDNDLIEMHRHMESQYSKLANERHQLDQEVQRLNKLTSDLTSRELGEAKTSEGSDDLDDLIFEKPGEAINKAISSNPLIKDLVTQKKQAEEALAKKSLYDVHPDFDAKSSSPEFVKWVEANPYRVKEVQDAAARNDYVKAAYIMSSFDEVFGSSREAGLEQRNENLGKLASVKKKGSGTRGKRQVKYRESQIQQLYLHDKEKYERMSPKFRKAYQEGRVIKD